MNENIRSVGGQVKDTDTSGREGWDKYKPFKGKEKKLKGR